MNEITIRIKSKVTSNPKRWLKSKSIKRKKRYILSWFKKCLDQRYTQECSYKNWRSNKRLLKKKLSISSQITLPEKFFKNSD